MEEDNTTGTGMDRTFGFGRGSRRRPGSALSQGVGVSIQESEGSRHCHKCGSVSHSANDCQSSVTRRPVMGTPLPPTAISTTEEIPPIGGAATNCQKPLDPEESSWPVSPSASPVPTHMAYNNTTRRFACFNCRTMGHLTQDCTNERVEPEWRRQERGNGYVPPEIVSQEELFGDHIPMGNNIAWLYSLNVQVSGIDCPTAIESFAEAGLKEELMANVKLAEYSAPTPIQKAAIPIVKAKRDLLALAPTGSGKTAAYILPILDAILRYDELKPNAPYAMILAPTHELSTQIFKEFKKMGFGTKMRIINVYGQVSMSYQISLLCGTHVVVGTPGRVKDLIMREHLRLDQLKFFVLDECDRMLEMGMLGDMKDIVNLGMPGRDERQTLMFSATASPAIQSLAETFMNNHVTIFVGIVGGANVDVTQKVLDVTQLVKTDVLIDLLEMSVKDPTKKTLVFLSSRSGVDWLCNFLGEKGIAVGCIHAGRAQPEREESLRLFKVGECGILVATDVAARGLDIPGVDHVINYDMPYAGWLSKHGDPDAEMILQYEAATYVQRIGRTGRIGNPGRSTSFFDIHKDVRLAQPLIKILREANQDVPDFLVKYEGPLATPFGATSGVEEKKEDEECWE